MSDRDERHDPEETWQCPSCGETYHEDADEGVLMNLGGVEWESQPTWCHGCAAEAPHAVEGYGVR